MRRKKRRSKDEAEVAYKICHWKMNVLKGYEFIGAETAN